MGDRIDDAPESKKRRDQRNLAIALALVAFIAIVFIVTILKLSGNLGGAA
jgi:hypothetical protein